MEKTHAQYVFNQINIHRKKIKKINELLEILHEDVLFLKNIYLNDKKDNKNG